MKKKTKKKQIKCIFLEIPILIIAYIFGCWLGSMIFIWLDKHFIK